MDACHAVFAARTMNLFIIKDFVRHKLLRMTLIDGFFVKTIIVTQPVDPLSRRNTNRINEKL